MDRQAGSGPVAVATVERAELGVAEQGVPACIQYHDVTGTGPGHAVAIEVGNSWHRVDHDVLVGPQRARSAWCCQGQGGVVAGGIANGAAVEPKGIGAYVVQVCVAVARLHRVGEGQAVGAGAARVVHHPVSATGLQRQLRCAGDGDALSEVHLYGDHIPYLVGAIGGAGSHRRDAGGQGVDGVVAGVGGTDTCKGGTDSSDTAQVDGDDVSAVGDTCIGREQAGPGQAAIGAAQSTNASVGHGQVGSGETSHRHVEGEGYGGGLADLQVVVGERCRHKGGAGHIGEANVVERDIQIAIAGRGIRDTNLVDVLEDRRGQPV